jgi:predicted transglutaminase-like protease
MSYYDMIFAGISFASNSDESIYELIFRIFYNIITNLIFGVIYAFFSFFWNLWSLVYTFSAGPSGIIFYFLAFTAGTSFLFTTLWGIFLAARAPVTTLMSLENQ